MARTELQMMQIMQRINESLSNQCMYEYNEKS